MKKEEEKSYALLFIIACLTLLGSFVWVILDEAYARKPWKHIQKSYYSLELKKLRGKYEDALQVFQHPDNQKKYSELKGKLKKSQDDFMVPEIQTEYNKVVEDMRVLDEELAPLKFDAIVTRNQLLEKEFLYGKRLSTKSDVEELENKGKVLSGEISILEEKRSGLQEKIFGFKSDINNYTKQLSTYTKDMEKYQELIGNLRKKRPLLQGYQVHLEDLNMADRCMSCHVGIDKSVNVTDEQPYASHPRKEVYLGNHPTGKFGCTLCHEGQARATTSTIKAHGIGDYWLKPLNSGKLAQSSCIKCHGTEARLEGGEELWKGISLFEELGCFGCHGTKGLGRDEYRMVGPNLTELSSKVNAEWLVDWLMGPKNFRPTTRMPNFMMEEEEAKAIASYLWQNSKGFEPIGGDVDESESSVEDGLAIFESVGCLACHSDMEDGGRVHGPNLARIGEKISTEYLVSWLSDPKARQPRSRMPNLRLDEEETRLLAAYLKTLKSEEFKDPSSEEPEWLNDGEMVEQGEKLIGRYGCFGCHKINGMEEKSRIGVELSEIGSKDVHLFDFGLLEKKILGKFGLKHLEDNVGKSRYSWLIEKLRNPRQFDEGRYRRPQDKLRMPNFGLSEEEIGSLSVLLVGLTGEKMPENYVELSEEKSFLAEGKRIVTKYNCMGCHQFSIDTLYLEDGAEVKGLVKLEEADSLFFQLWEDSEKLGKKAGETTQIPKKQIKNRIVAEGGEIASFIVDYYTEVEGMMPEEAKVFAPPLLYNEGKKVQFTWLFKFLNMPVSLRPWLEVRMPRFNFHGDEATALVRYFATRDGVQYPYEFYKETDKEYIEAKEQETALYLTKARDLFESKNIKCASCHVRGEKTPEGDPSGWAPDLSRVKNRLKPSWILRWLLNPQSILPGTKMPKFFREGSFQDIFPGTPEVQTEAIKDLLMNFPDDMQKEDADT